MVTGKVTPQVLRHFGASQLYLSGMELLAIEELRGDAWTGTATGDIDVHATQVEETRVTGQRRAADRWKGLAR